VIVRSTFEKAKKAIEEYCIEKEQDIFIYEVKHYNGKEYVLLLRDEITFPDSPSIKFAYILPFSWAFKNKKNAERASKIWAKRRKKPVIVEEHSTYIKGYRTVTHYTLIDKIE